MIKFHSLENIVAKLVGFLFPFVFVQKESTIMHLCESDGVYCWWLRKQDKE